MKCEEPSHTNQPQLNTYSQLGSPWSTPRISTMSEQYLSNTNSAKITSPSWEKGIQGYLSALTGLSGRTQEAGRASQSNCIPSITANLSHHLTLRNFEFLPARFSPYLAKWEEQHGMCFGRFKECICRDIKAPKIFMPCFLNEVFFFIHFLHPLTQPMFLN